MAPPRGLILKGRLLLRRKKPSHPRSIGLGVLDGSHGYLLTTRFRSSKPRKDSCCSWGASRQLGTRGLCAGRDPHTGRTPLGPHSVSGRSGIRGKHEWDRIKRLG